MDDGKRGSVTQRHGEGWHHDRPRGDDVGQQIEQVGARRRCAADQHRFVRLDESHDPRPDVREQSLGRVDLLPLFLVGAGAPARAAVEPLARRVPHMRSHIVRRLGLEQREGVELLVVPALDPCMFAIDPHDHRAPLGHVPQVGNDSRAGTP